MNRLITYDKNQKRYLHKFSTDGFDTLFQKVCAKLYAFEDLEDELGCPLEVVFKAIRNGIWFKSDDFITKNLEKDLATRPRLYYSDDFKCYRFEIGFGLHYVALKDYGKTWWLKGDKDEN